MFDIWLGLDYLALLFVVANTNYLTVTTDENQHAYFSRSFVYISRNGGWGWVHAVAEDWVGIHCFVRFVRRV